MNEIDRDFLDDEDVEEDVEFLTKNSQKKNLKLRKANKGNNKPLQKRRSFSKDSNKDGKVKKDFT